MAKEYKYIHENHLYREILKDVGLPEVSAMLYLGEILLYIVERMDEYFPPEPEDYLPKRPDPKTNKRIGSK
jgi:hypothetical protein